MRDICKKAIIILLLILSPIILSGCVPLPFIWVSAHVLDGISRSISEPGWNTDKNELSPNNNGNADVAIRELKRHTPIADIATEATPEDVIKSPGDFYGKVLYFTGTVHVLDDLGFNKKMGGNIHQILIITSDNTYIEGFYLGDVTGIEKRQSLTVYGYPVGRYDQVPNSRGGTNSRLFMIGSVDPPSPKLSKVWNRRQDDPAKNGNIFVAIREMKLHPHPNLSAIATTESISTVINNPRQFYGEVLSVTGRVVSAPEVLDSADDISEFAGMKISRFRLRTDEGIFVDGYFYGDLSNFYQDQSQTVCGYLVGAESVLDENGQSSALLTIYGRHNMTLAGIRDALYSKDRK